MLGQRRPLVGTRLVEAALFLVTVAAWGALLAQPNSMSVNMPAGASVLPVITGLVAFVAAWTVMMAAMMLPSAAPLVLLYRGAAGGGGGNTAPLAAGYLLTWALFGAAVYLIQQALAFAAGRSMVLQDGLPYGVAASLLAAGVYQFTPLKDACLRQCRRPLDFLVQRWRPGARGAFRLGVEHGGYCVGCCWGLMAVLVVAGAMGLAWVALLTLVIFAEKLLPGGRRTAQLTGAALVGLGLVVAVRPEVAMLLRGGGMGM